MNGDQLQTLQLWSVQEDRLVRKLGAYVPNRISVSFSPDGDWLILVDETNSQLLVWKLPSGDLVGRIPAPRRKKANFPRDRLSLDHRFGKGRVLVMRGTQSSRSTGSAPLRRLVDLETTKILCDLQPLPNGFRSKLDAKTAGSDYRMAWSDDRGGCHVTTWNLKTGTAEHRDVGKTNWRSYGTYAQFNHDATRLLVYGSKPGRFGRTQSTVELWDLAQNTKIREHVNSRLMSYSSSGFFANRETITLSPRSSFSRFRSGSRAICWKWKDGRDAAARTVLFSDKSKRWSINQGESGLIFSQNHTAVDTVLKGTAPLRRGVNLGTSPNTSAVLSPDKKIVALTPPSVEVRTRTRSQSRQFVRGKTSVSKQHVVTYVSRATPVPPGLWNASTGKRICAFPKEHRFQAFDVTGRWCCTISPDREVTIWDARSGQPVRRVQLPWPIGAGSVALTRIKVAPSGERLAILSHGALLLWDARSNRRLRSIDVA
ncbi:MAG: hypothetical protein IH935_04475, partial [Acidobacteria bacterium]|nr:hypothetical protein [Acidobacteriota bacterium]